jgi:hypothetical protein
LGLLALFSFNIWQDFKIFGLFTVFEAMADFTTNIILPLGGALFTIFAGWIILPHEAKRGLLIEQPILFKVLANPRTLCRP